MSNATSTGLPGLGTIRAGIEIISPQKNNRNLAKFTTNERSAAAGGNSKLNNKGDYEHTLREQSIREETLVRQTALPAIPNSNGNNQAAANGFNPSATPLSPFSPALRLASQPQQDTNQTIVSAATSNQSSSTLMKNGQTLLVNNGGTLVSSHA